MVGVRYGSQLASVGRGYKLRLSKKTWNTFQSASTPQASRCRHGAVHVLHKALFGAGRTSSISSQDAYYESLPDFGDTKQARDHGLLVSGWPLQMIDDNEFRRALGWFDS